MDARVADLDRLGAGGERVDEDQMRVGRLGGEIAEQRAQAGGDSTRPVVLVVLVGLDRHEQRLVQADLLGAEEGVVLGRVHLVEGLVGDVRAAGDLRDREVGEPLLGDDRGGRVDDSLALVFDDELARQVVAPARQAAFGAQRPIGLAPRRSRRPSLPASRPAPSPVLADPCSGLLARSLLRSRPRRAGMEPADRRAASPDSTRPMWRARRRALAARRRDPGAAVRRSPHGCRRGSP